MAKQSVHGGAPVPEKAAAAPQGRRGIEATEEQARAIISTARRAVAEAKISGKPSMMKRSLECFLESRRPKKKAASASAASPRYLESSPSMSSSSSSN
ncbi:hypothetical protein U9M48_026556 [Paspalum notatum var. saurae]|uniref:Uncharacterized protein n=1 Tax=Paspalum notatum var. saurae TaxID=547442 RepID=A0AAQ3TSI8_PASNO